MRKFVNKEGQTYWVSKDFELSIMEKEGYTEVKEEPLEKPKESKKKSK